MYVLKLCLSFVLKKQAETINIFLKYI